MSDELQATAVSPEEAERAVWRHVAEQCFAAWSRASEQEKLKHLLTGPALAWAELELLANPEQHTLRYRLFLTQSLSHEDQDVAIPRLGATPAVATQTRRRIPLAFALSVLLTVAVAAPLMYLAAERITANRAASRTVQTDPVAPVLGEGRPGLQPPGLVVDVPGEPAASNAPPSQTTAAPIDQPTPEIAAPNNVDELPGSTPTATDPQHDNHQRRERLRTQLQRLYAAVSGAEPSRIEPMSVSEAAIDLVEELRSVPSIGPGYPPEQMAALASFLAARAQLVSPQGPHGPQGAIESQLCDGGRSVAGRHSGQYFSVWDSRAGRVVSTAEIGLPQSRLASLDSRCKQLFLETEDYGVEAISLATGNRIGLYKGAEATLTGIATSQDGRTIAVASRDGTARLWKAGTGAVRAELRGHEGPLLGAAFDPTGKRLVTWAEDRSARIWEAATGRQIAVLDQHNGTVTHAQFTASGNYVVTTSVDGFVRIWDTRNGAVTTLQARGASILSATSSNDERLIAVSTQNSSIEIWSLSAGTFVARLDNLGETLRKFSFSPDATSIVMLSWRGRLAIWQAQGGHVLPKMVLTESLASDYEFEPNGDVLKALMTDGTIVSWPTHEALTAVLDAVRANH